MKVGARKLRGKSTKVVAKRVVKKAKAIQTVQSLREGFKKASKLNPFPYFRYSNVSVSDVSNEKFPEMVQITAGPAKYRHLMGKKYVNPTFAMMAINEAQAETLIGKGRKSVESELVSAGLIPFETVSDDE